MNTTSPSKRRALAPLDANTRSPLAAPRLSPSKLDLPKTKTAMGTSPTKPGTIKRPIEQENGQEAPGSAKKQRLSGGGSEQLSSRNERPTQKEVDDTPRPRSTSPEDSSVFDNSTIDNTEITVITEPDVESAAPAVAENRLRPRSMTRDEARQKAEILRLRLGLASYKVRTNQADVPLERLQIRPLPGRFLKQTPSAVSLPPLLKTPPRTIAKSPRDEEKALSDSEKSEGAFSRRALPTAPSQRRTEPSSSISHAEVDKSPVRGQEVEPTFPPASLNTPMRQLADDDDELTDSGRGGAAKGLLSLSQSSPASSLK
ncbi:hypothetical protein HD806DRAFT_37500 [Xylariaceae sp. AK1471]|nr:hypothetical protein HD806DRAFT_37500 [Xylariaceae sp. AK1471]